MIFVVTELFAALLKEARRESYDPLTGRPYTQDRLGELLGVSNSAISKWETGHGVPGDPETIYRLAERLGRPSGPFMAAAGIKVESPPLTDREMRLVAILKLLPEEPLQEEFLVLSQALAQGLRQMADAGRK